jgi:hydrogenase maturation protease
VKKALIIGYGNTLRSDDGVGVWIADKIALLDLPGVEVRTCHQLGFELVEDLASFDSVIFVDAAASGEPASHRSCVPTEVRPLVSEHNVTPDALQVMAYEFFGVRIDMHLFTVRGESFEFGSEISPSVQQRAVDVINEISALLRQSTQAAPQPDCILS